MRKRRRTNVGITRMMHVGRYGGAGLGDADEEECSPEGQLQTDLKIQIYLKMTSIPTRSNTPPPSRGASPGDAEMPAASALLPLSFAFYNSVAINPQRDRVTSNKKKTHKPLQIISAQQVGRRPRHRRSCRFLFSSPLHPQEKFNVTKKEKPHIRPRRPH